MIIYSIIIIQNYLFSEDLVLAEERTTEKDKKRIMEGMTLFRYMNLIRIHLYIL